jgi:hypothetical protein
MPVMTAPPTIKGAHPGKAVNAVANTAPDKTKD